MVVGAIVVVAFVDVVIVVVVIIRLQGQLSERKISPIQHGIG